MKRIWRHLSLVAAALLLMLSFAASLQGQQSDQDPAPATPHPSDTAGQYEAQMPASGEATTHEAKTFTGRIVKENGGLVLKDRVTKVSYKLDDAAKARQYIGKQVKVTGKLDMDSNTIQIESIELLG